MKRLATAMTVALVLAALAAAGAGAAGKSPNASIITDLTCGENSESFTVDLWVNFRAGDEAPGLVVSNEGRRVFKVMSAYFDGQPVDFRFPAKHGTLVTCTAIVDFPDGNGGTVEVEVVAHGVFIP